MQKKMLEINPRHPMLLELLRRVSDDPDDPVAARAATTLYRTAALRYHTHTRTHTHRTPCSLTL